MTVTSNVASTERVQIPNEKKSELQGLVERGILKDRDVAVMTASEVDFVTRVDIIGLLERKEMDFGRDIRSFLPDSQDRKFLLVAGDNVYAFDDLFSSYAVRKTEFPLFTRLEALIFNKTDFEEKKKNRLILDRFNPFLHPPM